MADKRAEHEDTGASHRCPVRTKGAQDASALGDQNEWKAEPRENVERDGADADRSSDRGRLGAEDSARAHRQWPKYEAVLAVGENCVPGKDCDESRNQHRGGDEEFGVADLGAPQLRGRERS
jgi:hypothetical protein